MLRSLVDLVLIIIGIATFAGARGWFQPAETLPMSAVAAALFTLGLAGLLLRASRSERGSAA